MAMRFLPRVAMASTCMRERGGDDAPTYHQSQVSPKGRKRKAVAPPPDLDLKPYVDEHDDELLAQMRSWQRRSAKHRLLPSGAVS
jgi:hypothetical protein